MPFAGCVENAQPAIFSSLIYYDACKTIAILRLDIYRSIYLYIANIGLLTYICVGSSSIPSMNKVAVLTGDVVDSTKLSPMRRAELNETLKNTLSVLSEGNTYDIYRGDSFQVQVHNPIQALRKAIQIRCKLRQTFVQEKKPVIDARISVGIGSVIYQASRVSESDGEAYRLSGRALDSMKESRLLIKTGNEEFDSWIDIICLLLDVMISSWSSQQSEVIHELLNGAKQQDIAKKIGITQASVNARLKTAHWHAVEVTVNLFEDKIKKYL